MLLLLLHYLLVIPNNCNTGFPDNIFWEKQLINKKLKIQFMISFLFMKFFEPFSMIVLVAEIFLILDLIIFGSRELSKTVLSFHFPKMNIDYMNIIMCLKQYTPVRDFIIFTSHRSAQLELHSFRSLIKSRYWHSFRSTLTFSANVQHKLFLKISSMSTQFHARSQQFIRKGQT